MSAGIQRSFLDTRAGLGGPQDFFYSEGNTRDLPLIVRGEGVFLEDDQGRRYIDVVSGAMAANLGHGNKRVVDAMRAQGMKHSFSYVRNSRHLPNIEASEKIAALAGPGFERVHFSSGGSESMEMAVKFLRQLAVARGDQRRTRLISLMPSFHGSTLGTLGWTGDDSVEALWGPMTHMSEKVPAPLSYRPPFGSDSEQGAIGAAKELANAIDRLGSENVLAFIMEPVGGQSSGANVPHPVFFEQVRRICDQAGIYLIFDEIMTACRSGAFLETHQHPECKPDIVVVAKGLGAGYTPVAAFLAPANLVDELAESTGFNLSHTYNANPISCAAVSAVIDEVAEHQLIDRAEQIGALLRSKLQKLADNSPIVGDVRGKGLLLAIEYVRDKETRSRFPDEVLVADRIRRIGLEEGLMLYSRRQNNGRFGEWSLVCPPLIITESEADEMVAGLTRTLARFTDEMRKEGVI